MKCPPPSRKDLGFAFLMVKKCNLPLLAATEVPPGKKSLDLSLAGSLLRKSCVRNVSLQSKF